MSFLLKLIPFVFAGGGLGQYFIMPVVVYKNMAKNFTNEPRHEKTNVLVFDEVRHKRGCAVTEDG